MRNTSWQDALNVVRIPYSIVYVQARLCALVHSAITFKFICENSHNLMKNYEARARRRDKRQTAIKMDKKKRTTEATLEPVMIEQTKFSDTGSTVVSGKWKCPNNAKATKQETTIKLTTIGACQTDFLLRKLMHIYFKLAIVSEPTMDCMRIAYTERA